MFDLHKGLGNCSEQLLTSTSGSRDGEGVIPHPLVESSHKKMTTASRGIDFIFLGPPPKISGSATVCQVLQNHHGVLDEIDHHCSGPHNVIPCSSLWLRWWLWSSTLLVNIVQGESQGYYTNNVLIPRLLSVLKYNKLCDCLKIYCLKMVPFLGQ